MWDEKSVAMLETELEDLWVHPTVAAWVRRTDFEMRMAIHLAATSVAQKACRTAELIRLANTMDEMWVYSKQMGLPSAVYLAW